MVVSTFFLLLLFYLIMFKHPHHAALALFITLSVAFGIPSVSSALKSTSLTVGSTGEQVKTLQTNLIDKGYLAGSATGSYDTSTAEAVKKFQTSLGLTADGIAGTKTLTEAGVIMSTAVATTTTATAKTAAAPDITYLPPPPPMAGPVEEFDGAGCTPHMLAIKRAPDSPSGELSLEATDDHAVFKFTVKTGSCEFYINSMHMTVMNFAGEDPTFDYAVLYSYYGGVEIGEEVEYEDIVGEVAEMLPATAIYFPPYTERSFELRVYGLEAEIGGYDAIAAGLMDITVSGFPEWYYFDTDIWGHVLNVYGYDEADETQCNDDLDNDGDGQIDYPADPGCTSGEDDSEYNPPMGGETMLHVNLDPDSPDAGEIEVEMGDDLDDVPILLFTLEAEDNDVDVIQLPLIIQGSMVLNEYVNQFTFINETTGDIIGWADPLDADGDDLAISLTIGEIEEDEEVVIGVYADLTIEVDAFDEGVGLLAYVPEAGGYYGYEVEDEEGDNLEIDQIEGEAIGGEQVFIVDADVEPGIEVTLDGTSYEETYNDDGTTDKIVFEIEFEIEALGDDIVIDKGCEENNADTAGQGFEYGVASPSKNTTTCVVTSSADDATVHTWLVEEGESEEFILIVTMDPTADYAAFIALMSINWGANLLDVSPDFFFTEGLGLGTEYETEHETVDV